MSEGAPIHHNPLKGVRKIGSVGITGADWEAEVTPLAAEFAKPDAEKELTADKALVAIIKSIGDKRPTDDHEKHLKDLAKKNEGTKVGARAGELPRSGRRPCSAGARRQG